MRPPQPVYGPHTLLADLQTAETLLTVTLRLFTLPWREPGQAHPDWREGFRAAGLPVRAAEAFEGLLQIVMIATRRPLDVRCLSCPRLGYDEGRLLQIASLFQHRRGGEAEAVMGSWLPASACRFAVAPAASLAQALRLADLIIPLRRSMTGIVPAHQLSGNPGLMLVQ